METVEGRVRLGDSDQGFGTSYGPGWRKGSEKMGGMRCGTSGSTVR